MTTTATPQPLREGDRVQDPVLQCVGRIEIIYRDPQARPFYRVQFCPGSPFIDNWAVYRDGELTRTQ